MKLLLKEIVEKILEFDKANHEFRFKSYDVYDHKGDIFVEYVTQKDHNNEGKSVLVDKLNDLKRVNYIMNQRIYLHYIVRDNYSLDNIGYYDNPPTKRGFELI
tara:strand:+ start:2845 stop:3153 length:309 start_codon:yes stop_codon:yes gene_type:complete